MVLEIIKLLFSKDTREVVAEAFQALKKTPEWKKDILDIEESFAGSDDHKAKLLIRFSV